MTDIALASRGRERVRRHAPIDEYNRYLDRWVDDPVYRRMLRHYRDEFIASYPDIAFKLGLCMQAGGGGKPNADRFLLTILLADAKTYLNGP